MRFIELQKGMVFTAWAASFNDENHTTKSEGKEAGFGTIAVNSKQIPFGSVLEIETVDDGKKYFYTGIAEDEIELKDGEEDLTLKLWFSNLDFGTRWVKITVKEVGKISGGTSLNSGFLNMMPGFQQAITLQSQTLAIGTTFKGTAVAYDEPGQTSTGGQTGIGVVAVDPKKIPYHTKLKIKRTDGEKIYGKDINGNVGYYNEIYATALDTGGDVRNGKFLVDIWMPTKVMNAFGKREVELTVV